MIGKVVEIEIAELGKQGDGIGYFESKPVYVPFALAGDLVKIILLSEKSGRYQGKLIEIIKAGRDRINPPCKYFADCGGCSLQHLSFDAYLDFKRSVLFDILRKHSLSEDLAADLQIIGAASRRRASFKIAFKNKKLELGFFAPHSHKIVDIDTCLLLIPSLQDLLSKLRGFLITLTSIDNIDAADISEVGGKLEISFSVQTFISNKDKESLRNFAKKQNISRISIYYENDKSDYEIIVGEEFLDVVLASNLNIKLPVNSFLQASQDGEAAIKEFLLGEIENGDKVADLYCGYGSYSFYVMHKVGHISAYEGNKDMIIAMQKAVSKAGFSQKIICKQQDLYKKPLRNLEEFSTIIINPPRNGAGTQIAQIAKSFKGKLLMVSCSQTSFARDLKILLDAGFKLNKMMGIDQFYWSKHIEIVASLER